MEPFRRSFELMEQQASKDPADATSRDRLANAAWQLGDLLRHRDPSGALAVFDRAIARQRELENNAQARRAEARLLARSSYALRDLSRDAEARERTARALELLAATRDYPAPSVQPGSIAETAARALADQQAAAGQRDQAIVTYRDLLDRELASSPHPDRDLPQAASISRLYQSLERLYAASGDLAQAARLNGLRRELWLAWNRKLPTNIYIQRQLDSAAAPRS
jgi:tetratricopeptide (TPR) repeat protein